MRFDQIIPPTKEEQQLDEVRLGQSDLDRFINSSDSQGIKAGFEAEMCFTGIGGSGETDYDSGEADYDQDERVSDIDDACNFFHDGDYNSRRDIQNLREAMQEAFYEWQSEQMSEQWSNVASERVREYIEENDYTESDEVLEYLKDHLELDDEQAQAVIDAGESGDQSNPEAYALYKEALEHANEVLDELVQDAIDEQNRSYDYAREEWEEENRDDYSESDWLRDQSIRYMSDVQNEFGRHVQWPYYSYPESEEGYSEHEAEKLARDLGNTLGIEVYASGGYHSAKRTATRWIIEPDSSLEADSGDMPAEIISPPMPLADCLETMTKFFQWADSNDAYTNHSTGLHVGVSLPHVDGRIDYVKLALFLGDKYVLEQFNRSSNYFAKSAFDKIKDSVHSDNVESTFELMRKNLIELATKNLKQAGHGKYTSINLKNDYIEFRSMGDEYHTKIPEILNTVKRYAYAMHIASRPDLYRQEYAKKLYKMLSRSGAPDAVQLFSQFASNSLSKEELVRQLQARNTNRMGKKANTEKNGDQAWNVLNRSSNQVIRAFLAKDEADAKAKHEAWLLAKGLNPLNYTLIPPHKENSGQTQQGQQQQQGDVPPATQARGGFTGYWKVVNDRTGEEVYRFNGVGNSQHDANVVAHNWLQSNVSGNDYYSVLPVMGNQ